MFLKFFTGKNSIVRLRWSNTTHYFKIRNTPSTVYVAYESAFILFSSKTIGGHFDK